MSSINPRDNGVFLQHPNGAEKQEKQQLIFIIHKSFAEKKNKLYAISNKFCLFLQISFFLKPKETFGNCFVWDTNSLTDQMLAKMQKKEKF